MRGDVVHVIGRGAPPWIAHTVEEVYNLEIKKDRDGGKLLQEINHAPLTLTNRTQDFYHVTILMYDVTYVEHA